MELFKPDFGLVFWMFVGFAVLFFILWIPFMIMSYFMEGMSSSSSANG